MRRLLELTGFQVRTAGNLSQAGEALAEGGYELLISDLGLPDGSGLDLIRQLRRGGNGIPAVALSGFGREDEIRQSRAAGFNEHLIKPVDFDALVDVVERVSRTHTAV